MYQTFSYVLFTTSIKTLAFITRKTNRQGLVHFQQIIFGVADRKRRKRKLGAKGAEDSRILRLSQTKPNSTFFAPKPMLIVMYVHPVCTRCLSAGGKSEFKQA
jgi:hypothetical protein